MASERKGGRKELGELRFAGKRWTVRLRASTGRRTFALETCRDPNRRDLAEVRARFVARLLEAFDGAGVLGSDDAEKLLGMACTEPDALLEAIRSVGEKLVGGKLPPAGEAPRCETFRELAKRWTTGELHRDYPDHVRDKDPSDDVSRFKLLNELDVGGLKLGDIPLDRFTLEHAERAMRQLPDAAKRPATRRHYAQCIYRVLALAVYPCRVIDAHPLPKGFLPKQGKPPAFAFLYPAEDAQLMACRAVPLVYRLLYGVLSREGLRLSEALALRWRDVDLERGVLTLDENKTDDPRAWALGEDVTRALAAWHVRQGELEGEAHVFAEQQVPIGDNAIARTLRTEHLPAAGVTRPELFASTANRRPLRVHDLRGTFVTLALACGRSETWVADRTGHKSSAMINRYRKAARTGAELGLGWLAPIDQAVPELSGGEGCGAKLPHGCPTDGAQSRNRTNDTRIFNPLLYQLSYLGGGASY